MFSLFVKIKIIIRLENAIIVRQEQLNVSSLSVLPSKLQLSSTWEAPEQADCDHDLNVISKQLMDKLWEKFTQKGLHKKGSQQIYLSGSLSAMSKGYVST